jgi:hypothetical protein
MPRGEKTKLLWSDPKYRKRMSEVHLGKKQNQETIQKRILQFMNEKSWAWKGNMVSYSGLHKWVARKLGKPNKCEHCGTTTSTKYEWANKSGKYLRDLDDWIRLCRSCHFEYDGISNKIWTKKKLTYNNV